MCSFKIELSWNWVLIGQYAGVLGGGDIIMKMFISAIIIDVYRISQFYSPLK